MRARLLLVAALMAIELVVVWGHRLPVLRLAASALAGLQRSAGLFVSRAVLLLPAAMGAVVVIEAVRHGELGATERLVVGLVVLLAAAVILTTYLLTRI